MQGKDLKNGMKEIIREEVASLLKETSYKFGTLANPKEMEKLWQLIKK